MVAITTIAVLIPVEWYGFVASVVFTLLHTWEEVWVGEDAPFWCYYRRHFEHGISDVAGALLFSWLALILIGLAVLGYLCGSQVFLGGLVGARVGDALLSHVGLRARFTGPNPGLATSPLYLAEALVVPLVLHVSPLGVALGFGAFALFWCMSFVRRKK
ncbi:HXXEE domain-containing protein [Gemmata sp. G18]|uniref:HXXEE domain-containing protein n=1 Tax=Gemmata palustris TaxID=2822762 RepID=A0ABS5BRM1_9BACT|nr:HXXEE domain-containing protein [Gemmata palustris]MBP3956344.1 HXXEE domain-containing protein [Gemmata palustris]